MIFNSLKFRVFKQLLSLKEVEALFKVKDKEGL